MRSRSFLVSMFVLASWPAFAGDDSAPHRGSVLTVRGIGKSEQKPDLARVEVTVSTKDKTLDAVVDSHQSRATQGLSALRDLASSGVVVEKSIFLINEERLPPYPAPVYARQPAPPPAKISATPFTAQTSFTLKIAPTDNLNDVMTRLAASGLFLIQRASFNIEKERDALNAARRSAMIDAREQAQAYAEAGNLKLIEITEVTDGEARPSDIGQADMPRGRFVQVVPPAVISFEASVNVTWRIGPQ